LKNYLIERRLISADFLNGSQDGLQYAECFVAISEDKTAMILFHLDMKGNCCLEALVQSGSLLRMFWQKCYPMPI
jgi:hypothetical protein